MRAITAAIIIAGLLVAGAILWKPSDPERREVEGVVAIQLQAEGWSCSMLELGANVNSGLGYSPSTFVCTAP